MSDATTRVEQLPTPLHGVRNSALIAGLVGLALSVLGAFLSLEQFYQSYLYAYLFWLGPALGSWAFVQLTHLTGGRWGVMLRRPLEAGALTLPLLALLFVPLLFGLPLIYAWARPTELASSELLQAKQVYLNPTFFAIRAVVYFVIWIGAALLLSRLSRAHDRSGDPRLVGRMQVLSGIGSVLYVVTLTLAMTDWAMSLDYHWFSSIYGLRFLVGQGLTTLAIMIVGLAWLRRREPWATLFKPALFHDLGTLLFAFVILWAYMAFAQYLIIWAGNISEEVTWYLRRASDGWNWIAVSLMLFHFALPFFLLLVRRIKTGPQLLAAIAAGILVMRLVDMYWLIVPEFHATVLPVSWMLPVAIIGMGGIWLALFSWLLQRRPLLPLRDARLAATLEYE